MKTLDLSTVLSLRPVLFPTQTVPIPEAGPDVGFKIRRMSMAQLRAIPDNDEKRDLAFMVASLVHDDGSPILADLDQAGQLQAALSYPAFKRLMEAIVALSVPEVEVIDPGKDSPDQTGQKTE